MIAKNNPFNIRYDKSNNWKGQEGHTKGFCNFISLDYGLRAGFIILRNYVYKKDLWTVQKVIERYAPSSENNTSAYISFVSDGLRSNGYDPDNLRTAWVLAFDKLFFYLCKCILKYETGYVLTFIDYMRVINNFGIKKELYGTFRDS